MGLLGAGQGEGAGGGLGGALLGELARQVLVFELDLLDEDEGSGGLGGGGADDGG